jgi:hypothetical protein
VSPPNALTITCGTGACGVFKLLAGAAHQHVELDVAATDDHASGEVGIIALTVAGGSAGVYVQSSGNTVGVQVCDGTGCPVTSDALTTLTTTTFRRLAIDVQWTAPPKLDVAVDGVEAFSVSTELPVQPPGALRLLLGCEAGCTNASGFRVDNVVVDTTSP